MYRIMIFLTIALIALGFATVLSVQRAYLLEKQLQGVHYELRER